MTSTLGLSFDGGETSDSFRAMIELGDRGGASTAWLASHLFQREPISSAAIALGATSRISIALMAMSPYSVHPLYATMAAATLDEYFPGRVKLCFGVGAPRDLEAAGLVAEHPLGTLREAIALSRALLGGETVDFKGERFKVSGRRLSTGARAVPIYLAASGPQMLELAGAAADGVLISAATSPAFIRWTLDLVRKGEEKAGRVIKKTALVYVSADADETTARDRLRRTLGFILRGQHHARNLELAGTKLDQAALAAAYAREDWDAVNALVTDDVVMRHSASGTPEQVRAAFAAYEDVGVDEIVASGMGTPAELRQLLEALE
ncbi:methylenetetrahydromethanopterin reductase [Rhodopseudomonas palustris HaA2]|uniref:Methylenetetrahydromethanopterin reductase n=1 Tax=Rhodopseudomonas palustris (strain HaA2) TaxID=316058 RepID=Q2IRP3_RHOP2|nr:LLM class flavin-dependent oxidoreductase [Rhodopseudomonas palustris]ABD09117.1 methylenetetrahydromethanopterin reductase [Rhodopseudomonas palustris HaA2]